MELTIASYNIHSGVGTDGRFDLPRIALVLREIGADVVALQECGDYREATEHDQHPEILAEILGMQMAFGPNVMLNGRRYGNAILSRLPIAKFRNYDLSFRRREPRGALRCDLDLGNGRPLHVFCLHLGLRMGERRAQEALLLSADILRDTARVDPVIVCGDFNYWWSGPVPALVRHQIHDAAILLGQRGRTYHSRLPLFRLDRIFVDEGVRPLLVRPHRSALTELASDHLPLVMRFEAPVKPRELPAHPVELLR
ncbi:MAG: endonuclease/exonuclease/phosphatase family protein [Myxococcales bacterium]|nr:endonuclease/exonuclease/phosphatase family protein [Myxococcales bacterium]